MFVVAFSIFGSVICGSAVSFFWNFHFGRWELVWRDHLSKDVYISLCVTLIRCCVNVTQFLTVAPFLNRKLKILSDSSTPRFLSFKLVDMFPEMSRKFQFSCLMLKSCKKMKNDIFLWCRYRVKKWLNLCVLWNVNRPGLWMTMSLCQATCMLFWDEPQHFLWRHRWQHKTDMDFVETNNWSKLCKDVHWNA